MKSITVSDVASSTACATGQPVALSMAVIIHLFPLNDQGSGPTRSKDHCSKTPISLRSRDLVGAPLC